MQNAIIKARELGEAIQNADCFIELQAAKAELDADKELTEKMNEFDKKRNMMYKAMQGDKPDTELRDKLSAEVKSLSAELMEHPIMKRYNKADRQVGEMLRQINYIIQFYVNPDQQGCGSDCSSCGGGCH
jgi:cell fate (sporulation/competence/biofilm development) regulator YlbF (YheA/YmcA/DUF963 family)